MNHAKYFKYFLLILAVGGLGCWISLVQYIIEGINEGRTAFIGNAATFAISIAITSLADQILIGEEDPNDSQGLTVLLLVAATLGLSCLSLWVTKIDTMPWAIFGMGAAMICWLIVNKKNKAFLRVAKPNHLLGER